MDFDLLDLLKLLAALGAGALIGFERELAAKPAGLRTNILICLGAAMFTILSFKVADTAGVADRGRIAAQVVTGVGFLGAGAIIQMRRYVLGLTTAATIWAVASLGVAFGAGEFVLGAVGLLLAALVLFGLGFAEALIEQYWATVRFEIEIDAAAEPAEVISELAAANSVRWKGWAQSKEPDGLIGRFKAVGRLTRLQKFQRALLHDDRVRRVRRL